MEYIIITLVVVVVAGIIFYRLANNVFGYSMNIKSLMLCAVCALLLSLVVPRIVVGYTGFIGTLILLAVVAVVCAYLIAYYDCFILSRGSYSDGVCCDDNLKVDSVGVNDKAGVTEQFQLDKELVNIERCEQEIQDNIIELSGNYNLADSDSQEVLAGSKSTPIIHDEEESKCDSEQTNRCANVVVIEAASKITLEQEKVEVLDLDKEKAEEIIVDLENQQNQSPKGMIDCINLPKANDEGLVNIERCEQEIQDNIIELSGNYNLADSDSQEVLAGSKSTPIIHDEEESKCDPEQTNRCANVVVIEAASKITLEQEKVEVLDLDKEKAEEIIVDLENQQNQSPKDMTDYIDLSGANDEEETIVLQELVEVPTLDELMDIAFEQKELYNLDNALRTFKRALYFYPECDAAPLLILEIGTIYKKLGNYDDAINTFREGRQLAAKIGESVLEKEFMEAISYLRIVKNILTQNEMVFLPFDDIPAKIMEAINNEFLKWRSAVNSQKIT